MASLWVGAASVLAAASGAAAVLLLLLYLGLRAYLLQKRRAARAAKAQARAAAQAAGTAPAASGGKAAAPAGRRAVGGGGECPAGGPARPAALARGADVVRREQELKRDTLHIFRQLQVASSGSEKSELCRQAVTLFDDISNRVGSGMASITAGRIVFCNALMECSGLDQLQECQASNDPSATALVERVVPIIFAI